MNFSKLIRSTRAARSSSAALAVLALGVAAVLLLPARQASGFSKLGFNLKLSAEAQRDSRVFNNFADVETNDNTTSDPQFPGWDGAEAAIWKACVEWGSEPHGNGSGDPLQATVGDGGANFDVYWGGTAADIGNSNDNVHSAVTTCAGGVLAYCEIPTTDGWRIRYCDGAWTWHDGPGDNPATGNNYDLQGVATHEYGHGLGLGHSTVGGATMYPSVSTSGSSDIRSIENDDIAGVQCIYGVRLASFKPHVSSVTVNGSQVTITGFNFSDINGEVWFTNRLVTESLLDPRVRVTGVGSTNGETTITLTIPPDAGPGDLFVKRNRNGHNTLSNAFPFDGLGSGPPLSISSVSPGTIENLVVGTAQTVTIFGASFSHGFKLRIDGVAIKGSSTWISDSEVRFEWEPLTTLGPHTLTILDSGISASTGIDVVANAAPTLQVGDGDSGNVAVGSVGVILAGAPGDLHYLLASPSNAGSVLPGKINLGIGNAFQDLFEVGLFQVGTAGTTNAVASLSGVSNTTLYWQSLRIVLPLDANFPLSASNVQSTFTP